MNGTEQNRRGDAVNHLRTIATALRSARNSAASGRRTGGRGTDLAAVLAGIDAAGGTVADRAVVEQARQADCVVERFGPKNEFTLVLAASAEDRKTCWRLVYEEYLAKGYTKPNAERLRYSAHDALPDTFTFLVKEGETPAGTVSIYPDSPLGLPGEEIYGDEIETLRRAGRTLVEIGRLTIAPAFANDRKILMEMVEVPGMVARSVMKADDMVITVNPNHCSFYERMMRFETVGPAKVFGSVCGAEAVLLRMDLALQARMIEQARAPQSGPDSKRLRRTVYRAFRDAMAERNFARCVRRLQRLYPPMPYDRSYLQGTNLFMPRSGC